MKAFVIKNKEGKYFANRYVQAKKIYNAFIFEDKNDAEQVKGKDDEVVEITIAEGDLEQQLDKAQQELAFYQDEIKNRGTCGLCEKLENNQIKKLQQQLAEKETKIIEFIEELAWCDAQYDAMQSCMGDMPASRSAIPNYAKRYFKLWKELFNEDFIEQVKESMK